MRSLKLCLLAMADVVVAPFVLPAALLMKMLRRAGIHRLRICRSILLRVGVFPINNHYYEPQFDFRGESQGLSRSRKLKGIDWNVAGQLELIEKFVYSSELVGLPHHDTGSIEYHLGNANFSSGDAEYWYQLLRTFKPRKIIEIGSGHSTLMAIKAIARTKTEDPDYRPVQICIEPYEMAWLEKSGVTVVREKVETIDLAFFSQLEENDILFIDSSHMIRPHGDVLFEILELLPTLKNGVIVHIHDIFSPRNYPTQWIQEHVKFWNEQYLLEAFLSNNDSWKIIGALNFLKHEHYDRLKSVAPYLTPDREPGSFYIQKMA